MTILGNIVEKVLGGAERKDVDIDAMLAEKAKHNKEHLDWKRSIVDLLKLIGMEGEADFHHRVTLFKELGGTEHYTGNAIQNMWMHREVMKKLAENGGKVPPEWLK